jgi:hypothetical protein
LSDRGALLFARYAYPPNALGYCGPAGAELMLSPDATEEIERRARRFEGAWAYLQVIAECSELTDPLDERAVEAYWVGNDLLDRVDPARLVARLSHLFRGQIGGTWREASARARPHHSFQVFEVYPWAERLTPDQEFPGNRVAAQVLDRCRIRTGRVLEVRGERALVESRALGWDGRSLTPSDRQQEWATWSVDGSSLIGGLTPGDHVALHWDWVCDLLTDEQVRRIEATESDQLVSLGLVSAGR